MGEAGSKSNGRPNFLGQFGNVKAGEDQTIVVRGRSLRSVRTLFVGWRWTSSARTCSSWTISRVTCFCTLAEGIER